MRHLYETYANYLLKPNGFAILKPEFLSHYKEWRQGLIEDAWSIIGERIIYMSAKEAKVLYEPHKDKPFYKDLVKYMSSGPCVVMILYKDCKDPIKDLEKYKDIVRKKWGIDDMRNVMHSSDSTKNMYRESNIFFNI